MKLKTPRNLQELFGDIKKEEEIHIHPAPKGFPSKSLQLFGRPKKLAKWGFKRELDRPGRVMKVL